MNILRVNELKYFDGFLVPATIRMQLPIQIANATIISLDVSMQNFL